MFRSHCKTGHGLALSRGRGRAVTPSGMLLLLLLFLRHQARGPALPSSSCDTASSAARPAAFARADTQLMDEDEILGARSDVVGTAGGSGVAAAAAAAPSAPAPQPLMQVRLNDTTSPSSWWEMQLSGNTVTVTLCRAGVVDSRAKRLGSEAKAREFARQVVEKKVGTNGSSGLVFGGDDDAAVCVLLDVATEVIAAARRPAGGSGSADAAASRKRARVEPPPAVVPTHRDDDDDDDDGAGERSEASEDDDDDDAVSVEVGVGGEEDYDDDGSGGAASGRGAGAGAGAATGAAAPAAPLSNDPLPIDVALNSKKSSSMDGYCFCLTGTLSVTRKQWQEIIYRNGGSACASVSKHTTHVVCGTADGIGTLKHSEAQKVGGGRSCSAVVVG